MIRLRPCHLAPLAIATCVTLSLTYARAEDKEEAASKGIPDPSIATSLPPSLATAGGLRPALAARGVTFQLNYTGEVLGNASGGLQRGAIYDGRLEFVLDADLEKLVGWNGGAFHLNAFQIHGRRLSGEYIGNLLAVSNIEAFPTTRLFEAWFEQKLPDDIGSIRLGQLAADSEFITSEYAGLFINGTFGWPGITAGNLPSGGPAYPLVTPGLRLKLEPTPNHAFLFAVFNGDPAGPTPEDLDPQERNRYGLNFRLQDPPLVMGEAQFKYNTWVGLPGTLKFGGWTHFGRFDDQRFGTNGLLLADPLSNQEPISRRYDTGAYAVIDQQIYRLPGGEPDKGVGLFARVSASPSDRNLIDFYVDAGLNFKGLIAARPDDAFGVAVGYASISRTAQAFNRDLVFFSGVPSPIRDYEAVVELTYQAQIVPGWIIQPNFQCIFHPGGHVPDPADPSGVAPVRNAAVFGVRTQIRY